MREPTSPHHQLLLQVNSLLNHPLLPGKTCCFFFNSLTFNQHSVRHGTTFVYEFSVQSYPVCFLLSPESTRSLSHHPSPDPHVTAGRSCWFPVVPVSRHLPLFAEHRLPKDSLEGVPRPKTGKLCLLSALPAV